MIELKNLISQGVDLTHVPCMQGTDLGETVHFLVASSIGDWLERSSAQQAQQRCTEKPPQR